MHYDIGNTGVLLTAYIYTDARKALVVWHAIASYLSSIINGSWLGRITCME